MRHSYGSAHKQSATDTGHRAPSQSTMGRSAARGSHISASAVTDNGKARGAGEADDDPNGGHMRILSIATMSNSDEGNDETPLFGDARNTIFGRYVRPSLTEMVGVVIFVFVGTMVGQTVPDLLAVAVAHGLAIAVLITCVGHISGGHFNPAVTLGVLGAGAIGPLLSVCYLIAQLVGAVLGSALSRGVLSYHIGNTSTTAFETYGGGVTDLGAEVGIGQGILCEIVLTFLLVLTVLMTAVNRSSQAAFAGFAIGLSITVDIAAGGNVSGASMNPARSFGPAVVMSTFGGSVWNHQYVYWVGPAIGALLASAIYRFLFMDPKDDTNTR